MTMLYIFVKVKLCVSRMVINIIIINRFGGYVRMHPVCMTSKREAYLTITGY